MQGFNHRGYGFKKDLRVVTLFRSEVRKIFDDDDDEGKPMSGAQIASSPLPPWGFC